jgi:hypothetical protein
VASLLVKTEGENSKGQATTFLTAQLEKQHNPELGWEEGEVVVAGETECMAW